MAQLQPVFQIVQLFWLIRLKLWHHRVPGDTSSRWPHRSEANRHIYLHVLLMSLRSGTQKIEMDNIWKLFVSPQIAGLILSQHKTQAKSDIRQESDCTIPEPSSRVFLYTLQTFLDSLLNPFRTTNSNNILTISGIRYYNQVLWHLDNVDWWNTC